MTDLDRQLRRLGELPADPRLAAIGPQVIAAAYARRTRRGARNRMALVAGVALIGGLAGGLAPLGPVAGSTDALTGVPSLAPSTLLAG